MPRCSIPAEWIRLRVVKNGENSSLTCSHAISPVELARYVLREMPLMYSNTTYAVLFSQNTSRTVCTWDIPRSFISVRLRSMNSDR